MANNELKSEQNESDSLQEELMMIIDKKKKPSSLG
jgi:hypothetical protein